MVTQSELVKLFGVSRSAVSQWFSGRFPTDRCPAIEQATQGVVTCEQLRPDVRWQRVPDANWPHPGGRPCIDIAAQAERAAA